jgi:hypothetical protein
MAVVNRNTLVLKNVRVVRDVVTGTVGMGFDSASGTTAVIPFSMQPPSQAYPQAGQETSPRPEHAVRRGAACAADRAGRSGGPDVFAGRGHAWPLATGGTASTAAWRIPVPRVTLGTRGKHRASVGNLAGLKPAGGALRTSARGSGF